MTLQERFAIIEALIDAAGLCRTLGVENHPAVVFGMSIVRVLAPLMDDGYLPEGVSIINGQVTVLPR